MGQSVEARFLLRDDFSAALTRIKGGLKDISRIGGMGGGVLGMLGGAASVYGVVQLGQQIAQLGTQGAQVKRLSASFDQLAASAGSSSSAIMESLRQASGRTINDSNLMLASNRAMMLGLSSSADELGDLMEVARFRGRAMGLTTAEAFSDIVTGVGRMSPMILDNLGIVVNAETTYANYAASLGKTAEALTDTERKHALLNAVISDGQSQIAAAGGINDDYADSMERAAASVANAKAAVGKWIAPTVAGVADAVTNALASPVEKALQAAQAESANLAMELAAVEREMSDTAVEAQKMDAAFVGQNTTLWADTAEGKIAELKARLAEATARAYGLKQALQGMPDGSAFMGTGGGAGGAYYNQFQGGRVQAPEYYGSGFYTGNFGGNAPKLDFNDPMQRWMDNASVAGRAYDKLAQAQDDAARSTKTLSDATGDLNSAYSQMRSRVESILFSASQVTAGDMFTARQGGTTPLHADENIRRMRAAIQNGSQEWMGLVPENVRGMDKESQNLWLKAQEEKFYAGGSPELVDWGGFKQQYQSQMMMEQNKEALIQRAMQELGPGANLGQVKQALGVSDYGDMGAQMAGGFETALAGMNPAQLLASRFTSDLAANKKLLVDVGASAWNTIINALDNADTSPLNALAARIAPMVAGMNSWNNNTGAGANP